MAMQFLVVTATTILDRHPDAPNREEANESFITDSGADKLNVPGFEVFGFVSSRNDERGADRSWTITFCGRTQGSNEVVHCGFQSGSGIALYLNLSASPNAVLLMDRSAFESFEKFCKGAYKIIAHHFDGTLYKCGVVPAHEETGAS